LAILGLLWMSGLAQAQLTVIGTATYQGTAYNLIWDDDNNGNSVVWLDYTNARANWAAQNSWAAGLDGALAYNIDPMYAVTWDEDYWRLTTSAGANPGSGYNQTTSEMGHLYYEELGLLSYPDRGNIPVTDAELNATNFDNLTASWYWSGTEYAFDPNAALYFGMHSGNQVIFTKSFKGYGLALRSGQVSAAEAVPEPATMLLFGFGLAGLAAARRKKKGNRA
jgi:hypothetical protein